MFFKIDEEGEAGSDPALNPCISELKGHQRCAQTGNSTPCATTLGSTLIARHGWEFLITTN